MWINDTGFSLHT